MHVEPCPQCAQRVRRLIEIQHPSPHARRLKTSSENASSADTQTTYARVTWPNGTASNRSGIAQVTDELAIGRFIHPDECIDCGVCEQERPVDA